MKDNTSKRYVILAIAYIHVLLTAGVVFGWAALATFYPDLSTSTRDLIFTVASSVNYLSNLVFGPFLDSCGARKCSLFACALMVLGALGMAAAELPQMAEGGLRTPLIAASFAMLGFAGPGVQMPTLRCELLFPDSASLVTSLNASLFDASCVVFLAFRILGLQLDLNIRDMFLGYAIVLFSCLVAGQVLFGDLDKAQSSANSPWSPESENRSPTLMNASPWSPGSSPRSPWSPGRGPAGKSREKAKPLLDVEMSTSQGVDQSSFGSIIRTKRFRYLVAFCAVGILRLNFVVLSIDDQLEFLFEKRQAADLITIFSILLPMGGLAAPLTSFLLSNFQRWSYRVNLGLSFVYGLCLIFANVYVQLLGFCVISVSRQLTYSIVFCLTLTFFGQKHLGKLLAANNVVVFLVSLLQYPVAAAVGGTLLPSWLEADLLMTALALPLLLSNGGL